MLAPRALGNCAPSAPMAGASARPLSFTVRGHMRLTRRFAVVLVAITAWGCTRSAPPGPIRTEIVEELPPTVCNLHENGDFWDDGHEIPVMGTLHLGGETVTLGDAHCPSVRVVLTKRTGGLVNFTSIGEGVLVRLVGTYHREPAGELDVTSIEPWVPYGKGGQ